MQVETNSILSENLQNTVDKDDSRVNNGKYQHHVISGDCNRMCTHRSTIVPIASHNPINGGNGNKEGINGRDRRKRGREWTNRKERE